MSQFFEVQFQSKSRNYEDKGLVIDLYPEGPYIIVNSYDKILEFVFV